MDSIAGERSLRYLMPASRCTGRADTSLQTPGIPLSSLQALCGSRRAGIRPCRKCIQFRNFLRCACELCCWHRRIDRFLESTIYRIVGVLPAASLPHLNRGRQENNRGNCTSDTRVQALTKTNTGSEARNLYIGFSVWEGFRCVGPATYLPSPFPVSRLYIYLYSSLTYAHSSWPSFWLFLSVES